MRALIVLVLLGAIGDASADPITLRVASAAPDGTVWARDILEFGRGVAETTHGRVRIRFYLNGVAGDEVEVGARIAAGQLDGAASGQMLCERVAPSMRISHFPALFQTREEATVVMNRLQPTIEAEAHQASYVLVTTLGLGPSVLFLRRPVRTLDELRRVRLWRWDLDEVGAVANRVLGLQVVTTPLDQATRAYDRGAIDGFVALPEAALAFQWSTQARYVMDLRFDYFWGCLVVAERAFNRLSPLDQSLVRDAAARLRERADLVERELDGALLGGLFQKQGLTVLPVPEQMRTELFAAAQAARGALTTRFVSRQLLARVLAILADYRGEQAPHR
jgi:TRAP-type C4-dicarboxylate transport system substrate-binding protein